MRGSGEVRKKKQRYQQTKGSKLKAKMLRKEEAFGIAKEFEGHERVRTNRPSQWMNAQMSQFGKEKRHILHSRWVEIALNQKIRKI
jgi:hypothetical protein